MSKKNKSKIEDIEIITLDALDDPILIVEEIIEDDPIQIDQEVEVVSFYVRALNGMKGRFKGLTSTGQANIELANGTIVIFKLENIQKVV